MIRTMLRTGGTVFVSVGALITAGSMNLAVLNGGPTGPGHLVIRAAATPPTTHSAPGDSAPRRTAAGTTSTSTTAAVRLASTLHRTAAGTTSTTGAATTTSTAGQPSTATTQPPQTTTTTIPPVNPQGAQVFVVRDAGKVLVQWLVKGKTIAATAVPNDTWSLPHSTKEGPDVTLRFYGPTQLVVWHAWVEARTIKSWIKTYALPS